ncbi:hypothetical protein LCGC14_0404100 [marine sediment metagenome]|uniref:Uncharacterized protein n=1 Tax=marine sediment metagenome TaxID=412755 RepID=A0A0F9VHV7_9ZZZZ
MKWYKKFEVGQEVRVTKIVFSWNYGSLVMWNSDGGSVGRNMNRTVGRVYKISVINKDLGYLLDTVNDVGQMFWYPVDSLGTLVGQQLLFSFMEG